MAPSIRISTSKGTEDVTIQIRMRWYFHDPMLERFGSLLIRIRTNPSWRRSRRPISRRTSSPVRRFAALDFPWRENLTQSPVNLDSNPSSYYGGGDSGSGRSSNSSDTSIGHGGSRGGSLSDPSVPIIENTSKKAL